jgi:2-iminobutanoate/2-iminopropanoate deaminase
MMRSQTQARLAALLIPMLAGCAAVQGEAASSPAGAPLRTVTVEGAPKAAGPYSQAVVAGGLVFTAGQIPRDPASGNLITGDIVAQTNRVLDNLEAVLKGAGCTLQDVVKVSVFMTDLNDFAKMNEAFAARFGEHRPARTTVQVAKLPMGAQLEMDMVARVPR